MTIQNRIDDPIPENAVDSYCVFGNPIAHSKSPQIHKIFAEQTKQSMQYEARLAPLDGFAVAVDTFIANGGRGASVTVPFKMEAYAICHQLSARAQSAGAVNTLCFRNGLIEGDNTDGAGLVTDILFNAGFAIAGKRVLLIGAGGAARGALLPLLEQQPSKLSIVNRTLNRAEELVAMAAQWQPGSIVCKATTFDSLAGEFDLVINASSASLQGVSLALPESIFAEQSLAYDMMYGAELTTFLEFASSAGAQVRDGLGMLIEQAAEAFYLWRGVRPKTDEVFAYLRQKMQG